MKKNPKPRQFFPSKVYHHSVKRPTTSPPQKLQNKPDQEQHRFDSDIQRMLKRIKIQSENLLKEHMSKIERVRNDILSDFTKDSQDINILVDKEQELRNHQTQFLICCHHLESRLTHAESTSGCRDIIPIIEKEFSIECQRLRKGYPIYAQRSNIVESVKNHRVTIVLGETGSGKSTQLVQYFDHAGLSQNGLIACTQPRKIAALSVAKFVASELQSEFGQDVGYQAGNKKIMNKYTRIIFMSDYEMFCEFQKDEHLSAYSCLIVDEVHERSIYTDLLLAMVKICLNSRPQFKLVVMSATIDPGIFQSYFPHSCLIKVPGRTFPVDVIWKNPTECKELVKSYEDVAVQKAIEVHENEKEGDILVFVATPKETEFCSRKFNHSLSDRNDYMCLSLHGRLEGDEQQKVFQLPPKGKRKVVFATNCAETSITIPNIKYVIDTGFAKEIFFDEKSKIDTLAVRFISRSSADQRKGRAGRTSAGKCFRLYSEDDYYNMRQSTKPEILRIHPAKAALKLFQMGANPLNFDFVESPPASVLSDTIDYLDSLGAISNEEITPLGNQIAELPFEPQMSLFVIRAMQQEMLTEAVSIACLSSFSGNVFFRGRNDEEMELNKRKHSRFYNEYGDMISLLHVLQDYLAEKKKTKKPWCQSNALNEKTLWLVCEKMREVFDILKHKLKYNVHFPVRLTFDKDSIAKLLFTSFECNTCLYLGHPQAGYLALKQDKQVHIHPSSSICNLNLNPNLIVFQNLTSTSRDFAFTVLSVQESWLEELSPFFQNKITEAESQTVKVVFNRGLGEQFARHFIGFKYSGLKQLEKKIREEVNDDFIFLDFSRGKSKLTVSSKESLSVTVKRLVEENLLGEVNRQQDEVKEIQLVDHKLSPKAVIKSGGCIEDIIMPSESRTVIVKDVPEECGDKEVREKLKKFGEIERVKQFKLSPNSERWGCVTFKTLDSAKECLQSTSSDSEIMAVACNSAKIFSECSAELKWTRRPLKGIGFVEFTDTEDFVSVSRNLVLMIWRAKISKKRENQLFLTSIPKNTDEKEIKRSITENYHLRGDIRVTLPRNDPIEIQDEEKIIRNKLDIQLKKYFDSYTIKMKNIKRKDFFYTAWVEFPSNQLIPTTLRHLCLDQELVSFTPKFRSEIIISQKLHEILKDDINKEIQNIDEHETGSLDFVTKRLNNGNYGLNLNSNSAQKLNCVKKYLNEIICGDRIEIGLNSATSVLLSKEGRIFLEEVEKRIPDSSAFLDHRYMTLVLQGTESVRTQLKTEVNQFIDKMLSMSHKIFDLHDSGRPKGLKRELISRYGEDLERLKVELNLCQIELHRNTIKVRGCEENIEKLNCLLYEFPGLSSELDEDDIDCVACFCPVKLESFYRLESCGHLYCHECLNQMVHLALKEKMFPLVCSQEDCGISMCWKDFENFCKKAIITQKKLIDSSFSHLMSTNTNKYRYCITPDCCSIYQITTTGEPYICYQCQATSCTTCHVNYHFGLTCKTYESCKTGADLEKWMKENPMNRRKCPNCQNIIEKNQGCQHMRCLCGIHICWNCMETFTSDQACYGHLQNKHGSFV